MLNVDDDLSTWSEDRIESEVLENLPADLKFVCKLLEESRCWEVSFERPNGEVDWSSGNVDRRLALFEAYGELWARNRKPPVGVWTPHGRPTKVSVQQHISQRYGDPADLDPEEIASVYGVKKTGD